MKNRRLKTRVSAVFLIFILLISVGYAELKTTLSISGKVAVKITPQSASTLAIGNTIDYVTSLNGVELDNWKIFYIDGDYTYIIYGDYLPNAAVDIAGIENGAGNYDILSSSSRKDLIDGLTTTSNWDSLLSGTLKGNTINYKNSTDTNIYAVGAPSLELWVNSWNESYPNEKIYIDEKIVEWDGLNEYCVGTSENPTTYLVSHENSDGYNNTLYYLYKQPIDNNNCMGYWITAPSAEDQWHNWIYCIRFNGTLWAANYSDSWFSVRPVICLPTNILK